MQQVGTAKTKHDILEKFPRVELANLPTPIQELKRFSAALGGPRIFVKRDDLTGLAGGGNKTRKLEFIVGDALSKKADCLITAGAVQSNHCRQTAAAAAKIGLECHLVFGAATTSAPSKGNYFLDQLLGAKFHWTQKHLRNQKMETLADELRAQGRSPYVIPVGGSNYIGALGYVNAMFEIKEQLDAMQVRIDHLFFGTSSGGTQTGLVLGSRLCGFEGMITGISIDHVPDDKSEFKYKTFLVDTVAVTAGALGVKEKIGASDLIIDYDYLGAGYGVVGDSEREAVRLLASTEGLLIGPVYTGRALGALIDYVRKGRIPKDQNVLFMHTGDDIALHAYVEDLTS
jgi:L-cysteate sulfo-lyase